MTIQEAKTQIQIGLHQNSIEVLINKLAEVLVENEGLKKELKELKKPNAVNP